MPTTPATPTGPSTSSDEIYPGITANPQIVHGQPVIAGTRIPVSVIVGHLAAGDSRERLCHEFGLTLDQIAAALGYAADLASRERVYTIPQPPEGTNVA